MAFRRRQDIILYRPSNKQGLPDILRRVIRFFGVLMFTSVILFHSPAFLKRCLDVNFYGIQDVSIIWAASALPCFIALIFIFNLDQLFQDPKKQ